MTKDKYFLMCEQMGEEPNPKKIPPDLDDFPEDVQKAIEVFNRLGDRIYPDVGYLGKDYCSLSVHMEALEVENKKIFLQALLRLDAKVIKKSQEEMKRERDKIKRQSAKKS